MIKPIVEQAEVDAVISNAESTPAAGVRVVLNKKETADGRSLFYLN